MNAFSSYHPAVLMAYFIAVLLVAMFTQNPVLLGLALLGGISFCTLLERPKDFLHNMAFYVPLFLMIAVTNPLFSHNGVTPLFFLNGNGHGSSWNSTPTPCPPISLTTEYPFSTACL